MSARKPPIDDEGSTVDARASLIGEFALPAAVEPPARAAIAPGDRLGRFEIVRLLGRGGFGVVYEARDAELGRHVAVKVLAPRDDRGDRELHLRLLRHEAQSAARLNHPAIVTMHDVGDHLGTGYIVLELLTGETLQRRLEAGLPPVAEVLTIFEQVARGLVHAHAAGVIHRDLKPSNVFLCADGRVKILDFGLARTLDTLRGNDLLPAGAGTPAYMAPEQWRGETEDARSDLYSLGVVLHESLTGRLPSRPAGVVGGVAPALGGDLGAVVARALAPAPEDRFQSAQELLGALLRAARPVSSPRVASDEAAFAPADEGRMMSLVLAGGEGALDPSLESAVSTSGLRLERTADGALVVVVTGGPASDLAARASRCALALRGQAPALPIAIVTGHGTAQGGSRLGQVFERGRQLLAVAPAGSIRVDDVTAGLLGAGFDVGGDEAGLELRRERAAPPPRTLLGRTTPFVGRQPEQRLLEAVLAECVEEHTAHAVLVTGPAGIGKSRLGQELVDALGQRADGAEVWIGRGHPLRAGSAFGMIGSAVRSAAGIADGEPLEVRQQKLRARVARHLGSGADTTRAGSFIGELAGIPFPPTQDPVLRAAHQDAALMADQVRAAFTRWVAAECAARPLVLVLEDLHWGDQPSVALIDGVLRALSGRPLLVLALARPEVHEHFPDLWRAHGVREIRLGELSPGAAARLCRAVLGDTPGEGVVEHLVGLAAGNVFFLEELVRATALGRTDPLPGSVLAMVHSRLDELDTTARRVVRAASIFGGSFWTGGVRAVLGGDADEVAAGLARLLERDLVVRRAVPRFAGEDELVFRHALVREAAYATLTAEDRARGHRIAAGWLELAGQTEAVLLAEHRERGGQAALAARSYARAAEQALEASDLDGVLQRAARAVACGAEGELLGTVRRLEAEAHMWRGEHELAAQRGLEGMSLVARGSATWYAAAAAAIEASGKRGHRPGLVALGHELLGERPGALEHGPFAVAGARAASQLFFTGEPTLAEELVARVEAMRPRFEERDPAVAAWIDHARSVRALYFGDLGAYVRLKGAAVTGFEQAGDRRNACVQRAKLGYGLLQVGAFAEAEQVLRDVLPAAQSLGLGQLVASVKHNLGLALTHRGQLAEGLRVEEEAARAFAEQGDRRLEAAARKYLAMNHLAAGRIDDAAREAEAARSVVLPRTPGHAYALALLARVHLAAGRTSEALPAAREAMALLEELKGMDEGEAMVRLAYAEALHAAGEGPRARAALETTRRWLEDRAARISDPARARSFLEDVPENARLLELARATTPA